jgi:cytochrome b subunit of formate dehydrogenase
MTPAYVRRALHVAHALTSVALIATGLLIEWPELRARVVGGYGLQLSEWHRWSGVPFIVAPLLSLAVAWRPLVRDLRRRLGPPDPISWTKLHIVSSLVLTFLLSLSGVLLWIDPDVPVVFFDATLQVHIVTTWLLIGSLPIHLVVARRRSVEVVAVALGLREPPELGFPLDDEPD